MTFLVQMGLNQDKMDEIILEADTIGHGHFNYKEFAKMALAHDILL